MITSLRFEAPADLSVGRVRIEGENGPLTEWVATPNNRSFYKPKVIPGFYVAEIAPAGMQPHSIIFEVKSGIANSVVIPVFSALSSEGNGPTFLDIQDHHSAIAALSRSEEYREVPTRQAIERIIFEPVVKAARSAKTKKQITVALAQEGALTKRESWQPFQGHTSIEIAGDRLNLVITGLESWSPWSGQRVRLSLALERLRVERLLLPMYRGGTNVTLIPSQLSTSDVELQVMPKDPTLRALVRTLAAGTKEEAEAVRDSILSSEGIGDFLNGKNQDPWGALLAALLTLRFSEVFGPQPVGWSDALVNRIPWAYDSYVVHARHILAMAGKENDSRRVAATAAVAALAKAQTFGSPFFSYSNQLIGDMLDALCSYSELDLNTAKKARTLLARWQRDLPLQGSAGAAFTWHRRDLKMLSKGILAPDRNTSGILSQQRCSVVLRGRVELGQISLDTSRGKAPKSSAPDKIVIEQSEAAVISAIAASGPYGIPAFRRTTSHPDDPNKGRFGGKQKDQGYVLKARFTPTQSQNWVTVNLIVEADESVRPGYGNMVIFCLHPTFQPQWIRTSFRGRRASISVKVWGGFTIGAWLPAQQVELECDLATLPDAPRVLREF